MCSVTAGCNLDTSGGMGAAVAGAAPAATSITPRGLGVRDTDSTIVLAVGMAVDIAALPVGCAGFLGVGSSLATIGTAGSGAETVEGNVDLGVDVDGGVSNCH